MIVVADTSPLNYLIRLGHAEILESLYGRVTVPLAVLTEMRHPDAPREVRAWALAPPSWIERMSAQRLDPTLPEELGIGEREAISLAIEHRADLLLIDDKAGRQAAWARQIEVAGTLAVLLQAALLGHLELPDALNRLLGFGFRASPRVIAAILSRHKLAQESR